MASIEFRGRTYTDRDVLKAMEQFDTENHPRELVTYAIEHDGKR